MPSSKPAPAAGSAAVLFYAEQRSALLGDPSVVKVPAARVEELIASGDAELFHPGHGRAGKTWAAVPASAGDCWPELALAARAFAGT